MTSDPPRCTRPPSVLVAVLVAGALACAVVQPARAAPPPTESSQATSPEPSAPPAAAGPVAPEPPTGPTTPAPVTVGPNMDYDAFVASLPDDFDPNYVFHRATDSDKRERDRDGPSQAQKKAMRASGAAIMAVGMIGGAAMLGVAGYKLSEVKKQLSAANDQPPTFGDLQRQQELIDNGQSHNNLLIAGAATAGGAFMLGLSLLIAGRKKRSRPDKKARRGPILSSSSRGLVVAGMALGLTGGASMLLVGALSDKRATKRPLLIGGGVALGVGALLGVIVLIDRGGKNKIAKMQVGPMLTRTTTGAALRMQF